MKNEEIIAIINYINTINFSEFDLETGDVKIHIKRPGGKPPNNDAVLPNVTDTGPPPTADNNLPKLSSPISGVFYKAPSPDAEAFVKIGDRVNKGDTVCILEAMKTMMEVKSDRDGIIKEVLVEDGTPVEENDTLFLFESN